jgi:predicted TIM-barrel fold metal-dependent hydrolase
MSRATLVLSLVCSLAMIALEQQHAAPQVDHHQHLWSPAAAALSPNLSPLTASELVKLLDAAGIRRAAVFSLAYQYGNPNRPPVENEYTKVAAENDWTAREVASYPDRLVAFCSVNPLKEYASREIARCASDQQLRRGLKMHFGNSDVDLANPEHVEQLRRVFRTANAHAMAVVVHMRSSVTKKRPYGAAQAKVFLTQILPEAPDVTVQIAHLAGAGGYEDPTIDEALGVFADAIAAKDPRLKHAYFDISGVTRPGIEQDLNRVVARVRQLGLDRVLYGSDGGPNASGAPKARLADYERLPFTDAEFRAIADNVAPYMK